MGVGTSKSTIFPIIALTNEILTMRDQMMKILTRWSSFYYGIKESIVSSSNLLLGSTQKICTFQKCKLGDWLIIGSVGLCFISLLFICNSSIMYAPILNFHAPCL